MKQIEWSKNWGGEDHEVGGVLCSFRVCRGRERHLIGLHVKGLLVNVEVVSRSGELCPRHSPPDRLSQKRRVP